MLALTRKTDYALVALSYLVMNPQRVANARAIAERYRVPAALLMNVLKTLAQRGIVKSVRGVKGGYVLAADPQQVTLYDVIVAVEGPVKLVQCVEPMQVGSPLSCDLLKTCPVSRPMRRVQERMLEFLGEITLSDIAADTCCCEQHALPAMLSLGMSPSETP